LDFITRYCINVSSLILLVTQVHSILWKDRQLTADIFKDELGVLKEIEADIAVSDHFTPKFHQHRPVPFVIKEKVEQTLLSQVAEGELIPVSEWVAPIVVVHKHDGGIYICGDFKVTINPVICSQKYLLPTPEEMFSALANEE